MRSNQLSYASALLRYYTTFQNKNQDVLEDFLKKTVRIFLSSARVPSAASLLFLVEPFVFLRIFQNFKIFLILYLKNNPFSGILYRIDHEKISGG